MTLRSLATGLAATTLVALASPAAAYPIDCAILLCVAGGWPASVECAQARAVFIARITPWPIEPPLQIWNCPMRARYRAPTAMDRLITISARASLPDVEIVPPSTPLRAIADRADIDISDAAFDFVRSVRVFEISHRQHRSSDGDCNSSGSIYMGSYGAQGEYRRRRSGPAAVPEASGFHLPTECSNYWYRSVFVEWRDAQGGYGHEEVHY